MMPRPAMPRRQTAAPPQMAVPPPEAAAAQSDRVIIALLDTGISTKAISGKHLLSGYNYVTKDTDTEEQGVLVVAAVGNDGSDGKPYYPAAYDTVLAAGSCDAEGSPSPFTQSGADIPAPGKDIRLASKNGKPYGARGTSYATGFVSAKAANLLLASPALSPEELREQLKSQYPCGNSK